MKKMLAWNQYQIKLLMAFLMVLDHLDHVPGLIPENLASCTFPRRGGLVCLLRCGGRAVYP